MSAEQVFDRLAGLGMNVIWKKCGKLCVLNESLSRMGEQWVCQAEESGLWGVGVCFEHNQDKNGVTTEAARDSTRVPVIPLEVECFVSEDMMNLATKKCC